MPWYVTCRKKGEKGDDLVVGVSSKSAAIQWAYLLGCTHHQEVVLYKDKYDYGPVIKIDKLAMTTNQHRDHS